MVNKVTRLIIVDTRQLSRIGDFAGIIGKDGVEVIIYDHHPAFGRRHRGCKRALQRVRLQQRVHGGDPQGKRHHPHARKRPPSWPWGSSRTPGPCCSPPPDPKTATALADLIRWGADLKAVSHTLARELSPEQVDVLDQLIKNAYIFHVGGIDVLFTRSESAGLCGGFRHARAQAQGHVRGGCHVRPRAHGRAHLPGGPQHGVRRSMPPRWRPASAAAATPRRLPHPSKNRSLDSVEGMLVNLIKKETRPTDHGAATS
ncbi:MAG: hypothetical protein MZV70_42385 [Desulfobacterales bacterium]|nr:hypothetical protein [Desulfobacterales bacterium]